MLDRKSQKDTKGREAQFPRASNFRMLQHCRKGLKPYDTCCKRCAKSPGSNEHDELSPRSSLRWTLQFTLRILKVWKLRQTCQTCILPHSKPRFYVFFHISVSTILGYLCDQIRPDISNKPRNCGGRQPDRSPSLPSSRPSPEAPKWDYSAHHEMRDVPKNAKKLVDSCWFHSSELNRDFDIWTS